LCWSRVVIMISSMLSTVVSVYLPDFGFNLAADSCYRGCAGNAGRPLTSRRALHRDAGQSLSPPDLDQDRISVSGCHRATVTVDGDPAGCGCWSATGAGIGWKSIARATLPLSLFGAADYAPIMDGWRGQPHRPGSHALDRSASDPGFGHGGDAGSRHAGCPAQRRTGKCAVPAVAGTQAGRGNYLSPSAP